MNLLAIPNEVLARIASQLHDPGALLALALTCKRLQGAVEGAAQSFIERATDEERSNLPRVNLPTGTEEGAYREWGVLSKYQQILKHRESLQFDQIVGDVEHKDGDKSRLYYSYNSKWMPYGFGVSNRILRSGVHKAIFEVGDGAFSVSVGIARPMDYCNEKLHAFHLTSCHPSYVAGKYPREWHAETKINVVRCRQFGRADLCVGQGHQVIRSNTMFTGGDVVGLVLDMDKGALSFYRNGSFVCEVASGLDGEYVWFAHGFTRGHQDGGCVPVVRMSE